MGCDMTKKDGGKLGLEEIREVFESQIDLLVDAGAEPIFIGHVLSDLAKQYRASELTKKSKN